MDCSQRISMIKCDFSVPRQVSSDSSFPCGAVSLSPDSSSRWDNPRRPAKRTGFSDLTAPLEIVVERDPSALRGKTAGSPACRSPHWDAAWRVLERSQPHALKDAEYQGFAGTVLRQQKRPVKRWKRIGAPSRCSPRKGRWWVGLGLSLDEAGRPRKRRPCRPANANRPCAALLKIAERRGR